jgi:hypothetical protein
MSRPAEGTLGRFFTRALLVLAPALVLALLLEARLSRVPNMYSSKRDNLQLRASRVEIVIVGSSHALMGVRPDLLGVEAFNLAFPSNDLRADTYLAETAAARCPELRTVLFEVSDFSFEYSLRPAPEGWRRFFLHRYFGLPYEEALDALDPREFSYMAMYGKVASLAFVRGGFRPTDRTDPFGFQEANMVDPGQDAPSALARHDAISDPARIDGNVSRLVTTLRAMSAGKVRAILFTTPLHHAYRENLSPARMARMAAAVRRVQEETNVDYWDFSADPRFGESDFADSDHLDREGANRLSGLIAERLREGEASAGAR